MGDGCKEVSDELLTVVEASTFFFCFPSFLVDEFCAGYRGCCGASLSGDASTSRFFGSFGSESCPCSLVVNAGSAKGYLFCRATSTQPSSLSLFFFFTGRDNKDSWTFWFSAHFQRAMYSQMTLLPARPAEGFSPL